MKITLDELRKKFDELISKDISREEVSEWAHIRKNAQDKRNLEYFPKEKESLIWDGIMYLLGVDLKTDSSTYLHTTDDFKNKRKVLDI